ncbi:cytochrome P450 [Pseudonocardia spinosispora]|uniref:cytochrome P450 n=1 Tax=Pseudonocardia spinosispora TaxID=103441 RepID=UPI00040B0184|nr:cytochrome P450 [Pseudonocardia spinosispora]
MPATCPVTFDPFDASYLLDPYPTLERLPAAFHSAELDMWVLTRHSDIDAVFRDPATFSAAIAQDPLFPLSDTARAALGPHFPLPKTMSNNDPPDHARIRHFTMRAFSARRTAVLEPRVRAAATELVDALPSGEFDLVSALSHPLPAFMIFALIGFPPEDTEVLTSWCGNRMAFSWGRPALAEQVEIAGNMRRYWEYCTRFVAERVAEPRDDFTSDLVRWHLDDPDRLTQREITSIIYGLSFAGHETTTNLTSNALRRLLEHRDQWTELCADPSLIPSAVEEALRYDTSVIAWRRITTRDVSIADVDIPAGSKLLLLLGGANRDPDRFADPDRFDIHRPDAARHLAFGKGIHFCLGAPLARMELRIVLELLTARTPDLELVPEQTLDFPPNVSFRGPHRLLLRRTTQEAP